ncbi:MAG: CCA-adding enzyme [Syntrophorhabdaceae bacterium PtaU1.Bin034]|nr:MAG: CCA-adding enzyme [Syntrophorhabdaceae bacterium PtaU1.Bin034]
MRHWQAGFTDRIGKLKIIRRMAGHKFSGGVYLVGGALREVALGHLPNDYDFALECPEDLKVIESIFNAAGFLLGKKPIQTHRIATGNLAVDITILDGSIRDDLLRRDFTINAMAYDLARGRIIDLLGGREDIERKIIRYPRRKSIEEDPLRMIKAMRHLSALRGFRLDPELKMAIAEDKRLIHRTAPERIKYEFDLIMAAPNPYGGIKVMAETGLLFEVFPELVPLGEMDREKGLELEVLGHTIGGFRYMNRIRKLHSFSVKENKYAGYGLLFHDLGKPQTFSYDEEKERVHFFYHERHSRDIAIRIMERLRFSTSEMRVILKIIENHMRIFLISNREATEKATRRLVYKMEEMTPSLVFLTLLDLYGSSKGEENESTVQVKDRCREVLDAYDEWRREPLPRIVSGYDLIALGFQQGPAIGDVLDQIREKQISGEISRKEEALDYAEQRLGRWEGEKTDGCA